MNEYLKQVNSLPFYLITGGVLLFILIMHPIRVALLPVISFVTSAQRQVLCSPFILSAMILLLFIIYP